MNKFKAINFIRSNAVMSKPVKDTYEFRCNGVHFATTAILRALLG